ncbi:MULTISPECIES: DUF402 domain-containing protein [Streptomycetaceae]|uniref:DUF402 domain-containing protein n=1 Tax=Streptantibioticus cattleyicolor (strain ATCC 35852 / DSM 46488 / JCM 4925 / NBRC 14057 / NRRL 8057) TaxID=1003195 RepID=F8JWS5_STREN|nr:MULTISPECIES: DUF402 domain-containing protein [Streptomycetaceae]AEW97079.1 hypothetical protein SCATT_47080 [Streptantibioticus cattleyicolor NRRL 8057 = DSM 46488]MYS61540.1 DUF402 domain-containing protein [Streptomyces sp. SID5468]CCB77402.1 Uncharacterized domain/protein associated with RNAses G and E [Streptantibioticus cattleyicolor NRRL 8057 = DSM 46488]
MNDSPTAHGGCHVVYTKYDGSLHWNFAGLERLGEDEHGVWLGAPAGSQGRRGYEPPVTYDHAFTLLFPRDAWWTATFNAPPTDIEVYCDITTVPVWREATVSMVDLDLDVIRRRDGTVYVDDEHEFAEHQARYGYPPEVVEAARRTAGELLEAVGAGTGPFGGACRGWLERVGG